MSYDSARDELLLLADKASRTFSSEGHKTSTIEENATNLNQAEGINPETIEKNTNNFNPQSTICNVEYKEQTGTGAIYGYEFPEGTWRTLFITSYQVLTISNASEVTRLRVKFKEASIENVDITPDWLKWLWS